MVTTQIKNTRTGCWQTVACDVARHRLQDSGEHWKHDRVKRAFADLTLTGTSEIGEIVSKIRLTKTTP